MKKNKFQGQFLEELRRVPIVQVACEKTGLSRNSIYRWRKQDPIFSKQMDKAFADGVAFVNDMSESQVLTLIKEKNWSAISFWLRHHHSTYRNRVEVTTVDPQEELTPEQEAVVREALKLASLPINQDHNDNHLNDEKISDSSHETTPSIDPPRINRPNDQGQEGENSNHEE